MNDLISIIIPVYNAKKRLEKCINSVIEQTYKNIQVLLIDDGSTDDSGVLCDDFAKKDPRILVIHQENQGVSCARNRGLENARGKYIVFADADDYLDTKACETLYNAITEYDCDIITSNKVFHSGNTVKRNVLYKKPVLIRDNESDKDLFLLDLMTYKFDSDMQPVPYLSCGVTAKIFSSELIFTNRIRFQENCRFGEDVLFNLYSFEHSKRMGYIDYDSYHFQINQESSTHKFRQDWAASHQAFMDGIDTFNQVFDKDKRFLQTADMMKVTRISSLAVSHYFHKDNPDSFRASYKKFKEFATYGKYADAVKSVRKNLLTRNQKVIVFMLRIHLTYVFALICQTRNLKRKRE